MKTRPKDIVARVRCPQAVVRITLGFVWIYQGVVPKLLYPDTGELAMLRGAGFSPGAARQVAAAVGIGEILFGLLFWLLPARQLGPVYRLHILGLLALSAGALFSQPAVFVASFNPLTLNLALIALAAVALLAPAGLATSAAPRQLPSV